MTIGEHTTALAILREEVDQEGTYECQMAIEMRNEFAIVVSFRDGKLTCSLWDERNCCTLGEDGISLERFKEWALIAIGKEPRSTYGDHYRATHPELFVSAGVAPTNSPSA